MRNRLWYLVLIGIKSQPPKDNAYLRPILVNTCIHVHMLIIHIYILKQIRTILVREKLRTLATNICLYKLGVQVYTYIEQNNYKVFLHLYLYLHMYILSSTSIYIWNFNVSRHYAYLITISFPVYCNELSQICIKN